MSVFSVQIQNLPRADCFLVKAQGSIDMKTSQELEAVCQRLLTKGRERLLFDFSNVEYINSQGLGVLLQLQKTLSAKGGGVTVAGLSDRVKKVFITTGVHKIMNLYENATAALAIDQLFREG